MVDQPVDILKIIAQLSPAVEEQVIDVPKIIQDPTPQRLELSEPQQLVEQLVEVPLPNPDPPQWSDLLVDARHPLRQVERPRGVPASPWRYTNTGERGDG